MITEGALMAAIATVIIILGLFIPIIGQILLLFSPLPFIIFTIRYGLKAGILLSAVTIILTILITGIASILVAFLGSCLGVVMGELYRRKKQPLAVLLGGSLTVIFFTLLSFIISIVVLEINPVEMAVELQKESVQLAEQYISADEEQIQQLYNMIEIIPKLITTAIIGASILIALLVQVVCRPILKRMGFEIPPLPSFRDWKFPKVFIWYYLIVVILRMVGFEQGTTMDIITLNLYMLLTGVMVIQGASFVFYYCHVKKLAKILPNLVIVLIFILPGVYNVVQILGIIDLGFQLRNKIKAKLE